MRGEKDRRAQALERAEHEIDRLRSSLEARVAERTLALERTIDELETMNATVSHDLRSPLAAVINFTAILAEDYEQVLDLPAKDYVRRISGNARTAVSLLDGLLAFSQSGREEMHKTSVDMRRLVEGVRDDLIGRVQAPVRGSIEIADLPGAYADPAMIRRVYTNLIGNALKFVRVGEAPRVEIGGNRDSGELVYFVRDRGVGFDMGSFDRLFNVFGRLHHPGDFEGHGVGLSIVARLVRRHGGRVWAQSSLGKGATFLFSLPLAPSGQRDLRAEGRAPAL
jgi:light-regulated signal transduction histidine kinase (bacteriophytochrome)